MKRALEYLDLAFKIEIVVYGLSSTLFWCSVLDLWFFIFSFLLFCTDASEMGPIFLHLLHIPRGAVGFILMTKLPQSHDFTANMPMNSRKIVVIHLVMTKGRTF